MEKLLFAFAVAALGIGPLLFFVHLQRKRHRSIRKAPFTDKLLRPAGESLRTKIEELNDKLGEEIIRYLLTASFVPLLFFLCVPLKSLWTGAMIMVVIEAPFLYFCGRKIFKLRVTRGQYELGFQGERAVGEELNQLLAEGCRVYHDLPFTDKLGAFYNIDHVILSPMGVFAVETKTRNKSLKYEGTEGSKITFDGASATMPWGSEAHGLDQARRNAMQLSQWLSSSTGERVTTTPILTFPGWYIDLKGKGDVSVLNPKQIRNLVVQNGNKPRLSEKQIQQIKHQLEKKCRDVDLD